MNIALLAHEKKKELMIQFCIAYAGVLAKHNLWSASALGNLITENVGLNVNKMLTGAGGVEDQIASRVSCGEIDIVLFFRDPLTPTREQGRKQTCFAFATYTIFRLQPTSQWRRLS